MTAQHAATITVHVPLTFTVRGGRKTIIGQLPEQPTRTRFDDLVAKALARAWRWKTRLEDGTYRTVGQLTKAEKINETYVWRLLRLNLLSPNIVEAALDGRTTFTVEGLTKPLPTDWREQTALLKFKTR